MILCICGGVGEIGFLSLLCNGIAAIFRKVFKEKEI